MGATVAAGAAGLDRLHLKPPVGRTHAESSGESARGPQAARRRGSNPVWALFSNTTRGAARCGLAFCGFVMPPRECCGPFKRTTSTLCHAHPRIVTIMSNHKAEVNTALGSRPPISTSSNSPSALAFGPPCGSSATSSDQHGLGACILPIPVPDATPADLRPTCRHRRHRSRRPSLSSSPCSSSVITPP